MRWAPLALAALTGTAACGSAAPGAGPGGAGAGGGAMAGAGGGSMDDPDPVLTTEARAALAALRYDDGAPPADPSNRVADDPAGPVESALAFRGQADEARTALDQEHAERLFQLLDARRERRLRHPASLGGAAEMLLARQRDEIFELVEHRGDVLIILSL